MLRKSKRELRRYFYGMVGMFFLYVHSVKAAQSELNKSPELHTYEGTPRGRPQDEGRPDGRPPHDLLKFIYRYSHIDLLQITNQMYLTNDSFLVTLSLEVDELLT